ncbi:MAG: cytochrome c3 family protein [Candidatus Desulfofervidaceae bacterium]|nr:cytochrome c3 family protein [Candidatus Desulfofervidaceae bacterium]
MKKWYSLFIIGLFLFVTVGYAQDNCLRCHPQIKQRLKTGSVHAVLKKKNCTVCHSTHTSDQPHLLKKSVKQTCLSCHKEKHNHYAHFPVSEGECDKCHDPHASPYKALLKRPSQKLCFECHKKENILAGKHFHKPVAQNCLVCHKAHGSNYKGLLVEDKKILCFKCHIKKNILASHHTEDMNGQMCFSCHNVHASQKAHLLRKFSHNPYGEKKCNICHEMKGDEVGKVKINDRSLCLSCHSQVAKADRTIYSHLQLGLNPNVCLDCHSPHTADLKPMLKEQPANLCFNCHQEIKKQLLSSSYKYKYKHPEVKDKNCLACHQTHNSNNLLFLKKGNIDTCLACHGKHIKFSHPMGKQTLDPRNKQPVNCVTCHNPMGTQNKFNTIFDYNKELCVQCHRIET